MKRGIVFGGGGLVGMAYHAGAIKALDEWGVDLAGAEVLVGTSAGSVMASYLAAGWTPTDFYDYAHGRHPQSLREEEEQKDEMHRIFTPMWSSPAERVRRTIGSTFALAASRGMWRIGGGGAPGSGWRHNFPSGMYSTEETRERLSNDLPAEWPRDGLYICAVELYSGRLIPFGRKGAPEATLPEAVLASTAIPGVFPPVRIGDAQYVDGGAASATSLNLADEDGCEAIICIAPLGYRTDGLATPRDPKMWGPMFVRSMFARSLRREVNAARERGASVLVVRPWLTELKSHGMNSMRHFDRGAMVDAAREGTLRLLEQNQDHPALSAFTKKKPSPKERAG